MDILLYIRGGLGNQLYQYAVSRYLQETGGFDKLRILTTSYKNYKIRNLEIENFILNNHVEIVDKISIFVG